MKEHKKATTGTINIKVYDDEGYTNFRKQQRSEGGDVAEVAPLFTVAVEHPGKGAFAKTLPGKISCFRENLTGQNFGGPK